MAAYLIVNIEVHDAAAFEDYKAGVPAFVRKHGGEYLSRGGACQVLEGDWRPSRLVLFRFPDAASVRAFFDDPDYQSLKALRQRAAHTDAVVVEGV